jgi:hypothetical protein
MNNGIEISNADAPPALREALEAAYVKRDEAAPKYEEAAATLARGENLSAAAIDKVTEIKQRLATIEASEAKRLAAAITVGRPMAALPTIAAEGLPAELAEAEYHASVMGRARDSLRSARDQAQAELAAAERAVINAVDAILDEERIGIAIQVQHHLDEAVRVGKALLFEAIAEEMTTRRQPPAQVKATLARLDLPLVDRFNVATNMWRTGDQAGLALRAARRAEMISGQSAPVDEIAAA